MRGLRAKLFLLCNTLPHQPSEIDAALPELCNAREDRRRLEVTSHVAGILRKDAVRHTVRYDRAAAGDLGTVLINIYSIYLGASVRVIVNGTARG